jgi:hypothetical protein
MRGRVIMHKDFPSTKSSFVDDEKTVRSFATIF